MEDLGYRVLTAQNGPEALSIEIAVSRSTDLVMSHGISGGEAGVGLFGKNIAGRRRRPAERAAKLRAVLGGSTKLSEADAFRKRSQRDQPSLLARLPFAPNVAVSGDRE